MAIELEASCAAFLEHWTSLRAGSAIPMVADFLDHPSGRHAPLTFMAEVNGLDLRVRLEGTGLVDRWGRDLTGELLFHNRDPEYLRQAAENYGRIVAHPCGCYAINEYVSGSNHPVTARIIYLPLAALAGRPPRVVAYSVESERRLKDDRLSEHRRTVAAQWVDIGHGVPAGPPNLPGY